MDIWLPKWSPLFEVTHKPYLEFVTITLGYWICVWFEKEVRKELDGEEMGKDGGEGKR